MNPEMEQAWPQLFGVGVKTLTENARRLGLTWRLTLGTVTEPVDEDLALVRLDGDTVSIGAISMIGSVIFGSRVYVITVPPAGNYIIGAVGRFFPGERIAITSRTANSATYTAEVVLDTVVAPLINGKTYRVVYSTRHFKDVADGIIRIRIREDSISGTELAITQLYSATVINQSFPVYIEAFYTAVATGDKTFVGTGARQTGTGNVTSQAASTAVTFLYVEYVSG